MGDSQNLGYHIGGPRNKDYSIVGLYWGSPIQGIYRMLPGFLETCCHPVHIAVLAHAQKDLLDVVE